MLLLLFLNYSLKSLSGYCLFHSHPFADSPEAIKNRNGRLNLVQRGMKDLMYPDNVIKMFATSNIEKFSEAISRSKEIASSIPGEGIISVLRGMIVEAIQVGIDGKGNCSLFMDSGFNG